jgi:repressor LexA
MEEAALMSDVMIEKVYAFVRAYIDQYGYPPSLREIARGCYINVAYALRYLDILEAQGRITRKSGQPRSLRLLND